MYQGKVAYYLIQIVRFDIDFIPKRNASLGIGSTKKGLDILLAEKISHSANIRRFIVFLIFYIRKSTRQLKCVEKIHLRKLYG